MVKKLRMQGNPILESDERAREMILARIQYLNSLNGTMHTENERRDCELYYMKRVYREFLELAGLKSLESVENPELAAYAWSTHPRFYELV